MRITSAICGHLCGQSSAAGNNYCNTQACLLVAGKAPAPHSHNSHRWPYTSGVARGRGNLHGGCHYSYSTALYVQHGTRDSGWEHLRALGSHKILARLLWKQIPDCSRDNTGSDRWMPFSFSIPGCVTQLSCIVRLTIDNLFWATKHDTASSEYNTYSPQKLFFLAYGRTILSLHPVERLLQPSAPRQPVPLCSFARLQLPSS